MKFRPCIDLHNGKVKQIVGSTLDESNPDKLKTNFTADKPSSWYSKMYRQDRLYGGHIIKLGPGNDAAAEEALAAWPGGLQIGGGITADNGAYWLDKGASHIIVTSYVFSNGIINQDNLSLLVSAVGKENLVLDLSCRKKGDDYFIVTDRWQKFTDIKITEQVLSHFSDFCDEFLIHAADVEGKCKGIEQSLTKKLASWTPIPTTYAGGVRDLNDMRLIKELGNNRLDATIGSALDIFGGNSVTYKEAVKFHNENA